MAKEVLEMEVKSNLKSVANDQKKWNKELEQTQKEMKEVNEEGKEVVAEMQILGLSINGLKAAWKSAASGAKFMFRSIKMGIISTGIGLFVVALGTIATWFSQTKRGAEAFETVLSGIGAAFKVIIDRVAGFGGGLVKLLTGDWKQGLKDMRDSFKNIGDEILTDTLLTAALTAQQQKLTDSQRKLNVETEKQRAEIERLKLIAEDVTKSQTERLNAAEEAFAIENKLLGQRIDNANEDLRLQQEKMKLTKVDGDNTAEELDREAELQMNVFRIQQESTTKQIELNNKINAIKAEGAAKELEALNELKAADAERMGTLTLMPEIAEESVRGVIQANNEELDDYLLNNKIKKRDAKLLKDAQKGMALDGLALMQQVAGEGSTIGKAAAIASATISGVEGVQNAFTTAQDSPITTLMPAYPFIQAGLAGAFSAIQIQKIMSGTPAQGGGGGGGGGGTIPTTPAPQMMSGQFELGGGIAPEATRAYVVTDEMTNSQNQLANIRRRATI